MRTPAAAGWERLATKLAWYARRARIMGAKELAHRGAEATRLMKLAAQTEVGIGVPHPSDYDPACFHFCTAKMPQLNELDWDEAGLAEAEPSLLQGSWPALGFRWAWQPGGNAWRVAPDTGGRWSSGLCTRIAYRPGNPTGDVRVIWEPARMQQLVALALLARRRPEKRQQAIRLLECQMFDWIATNPLLKGVHYISAMECALRIIALCHALDLARDSLSSPAVWQAVLALIDGHARVIERRLSLYSSAGNHTIAEAAGLVYAGVLLPELAGAARWRKRGLTLLAREAERQVLPDGGGAEQALRYHLFVVELLGLVATLMRAQGLGVPRAIEAAFTRGRVFLRLLASSAATLPPVGDSDDGRALSPWLQLIWDDDHTANAPTLQQFPETGYALLQPHASCRERVLFDCGPLGMAPAYGHGHADALAVLYEREGSPILFDPGTFTYGGDPEWRRYFRSTAAHNTVTLDGRDQALQQGAFLWSRPFRATLLHHEALGDGGLLAVGCHDGYGEMTVVHWRAIGFDPEGFWVVCDRLEGEGTHEAALHWHTPARASDCGRGFILETESEPLWLCMSGGEASVHRGQGTPPLGWTSSSYGRMEEATTLRLLYRGPLPHMLVTVFSGTTRDVPRARLEARTNSLAEAIRRASQFGETRSFTRIGRNR